MLAIQTSTDSSKPPLNVIQEPVQNPKQEKLVVGLRSKIERTPIKVNKVGPNIAFCTLDKHVFWASVKQRFKWAKKHKTSLVIGDEGGNCLVRGRAGNGV